MENDNEKTKRNAPKVYNIGINSEGDFVDTVSIVSDPAVEQNFVWFNRKGKPPVLKTSNKFRFNINDEKRMILGVAMLPNKIIPRFDEETKQKYYVIFDKASIRKIVDNASRYGKIWVNLEHSAYTEGAWVVESWIKESNNDKSTDYGFQDSPIGTWFVAMKVDSAELWDEIKAGKFNGFSIEGFLSMVESNIIFSNESSNDMAKLFKRVGKGKTTTQTKDGDQKKAGLEGFQNAMNARFDRIKEFVTDPKRYDFLLVSDGTQLFEYEAQWLVTTDANPDALEVADGTFELDNGEVLEIANGVLQGDETEETETSEQTQSSEELQSAITESVVAAINSTLDERFAALTQRIDSMESDVNEALDGVEEQFKLGMKPDNGGDKKKQKQVKASATLADVDEENLTPLQKHQLKMKRIAQERKGRQRRHRKTTHTKKES